jgi:iron-sulfur cluster repair protein YtfE (RIC family)
MENMPSHVFLTQHDDAEGELSAIRQTILMYHPPASNVLVYRALLTQLRMLEKDLHVHSIMEEAVLIPKALQMETGLIEKLKRSAPLN